MVPMHETAYSSTHTRHLRVPNHDDLLAILARLGSARLMGRDCRLLRYLLAGNEVRLHDRLGGMHRCLVHVVHRGHVHCGLSDHQGEWLLRHEFGRNEVQLCEAGRSNAATSPPTR